MIPDRDGSGSELAPIQPQLTGGRLRQPPFLGKSFASLPTRLPPPFERFVCCRAGISVA